jgi:hypothetical protein
MPGNSELQADSQDAPTVLDFLFFAVPALASGPPQVERAVQLRRAAELVLSLQHNKSHNRVVCLDKDGVLDQHGTRV